VTCDRVQRAISALMDGEGGLTAPLCAHLDECPPCRRFRDVSSRVAGGYRGELRRGREALRRLDQPRRRRAPRGLAAALLLLVVLGVLTLRRPEAPRPPKEPGPTALPLRRVFLLDLPLTLASEPPRPGAPDLETPVSEWMRALPVRLSEDSRVPAKEDSL